MQEDRGGEEALWARESKDLLTPTHSFLVHVFMQCSCTGYSLQVQTCMRPGRQRAPNKKTLLGSKKFPFLAVKPIAC